MIRVMDDHGDRQVDAEQLYGAFVSGNFATALECTDDVAASTLLSHAVMLWRQSMLMSVGKLMNKI